MTKNKQEIDKKIWYDQILCDNVLYNNMLGNRTKINLLTDCGVVGLMFDQDILWNQFVQISYGKKGEIAKNISEVAECLNVYTKNQQERLYIEEYIELINDLTQIGMNFMCKPDVA